MAAVDCSKTPRSKSIKARALTLRDYEARKLAQDGRVLVVREAKPQPPADCDRCWVDYTHGVPTAVHYSYPGQGSARIGLCESPLGPVGSPLIGMEAHYRDWREPGVAVYAEAPEWGKYRDQPGPRRSMSPDGREPSRAECRAAMLPKFWSRRTAEAMPRWASRFPRLAHAGCEVKRVRDVTWGDIAAIGLPDQPREQAIFGSKPPEILTVAPYGQLITTAPMSRDAWAWCSLVVDLDRLEVADA